MSRAIRKLTWGESLNDVIMHSKRVFERCIYAVLTLVLRIITPST